MVLTDSRREDAPDLTHLGKGIVHGEVIVDVALIGSTDVRSIPTGVPNADDPVVALRRRLPVRETGLDQSMVDGTT
jgi:hypothetical protein